MPVTYRRDREAFPHQATRPPTRQYRLGVVSLQVRRVRFARWVDRAIRDAQARGMSTNEIVAATHVGSSTFYRWRNGNWNEDPQRVQVRNFCTGLGLPLDEAYRALDWHTDEREPTAPAPIESPRLRELAQLLGDPSTSPEDRAMIEEMLRIWVARLRMNRRAAER
jgi:transcriptional regulator with XRE-family HTH domain